MQNICLQAREGEKQQLKDGKSRRHTQRFAGTQVAYQKLDGIVFNILNQTKMLFTALFVFLIVGRRSLRGLSAFDTCRDGGLCQYSDVISFFAQPRAAVKNAVFGIGDSHRGRLDAVSKLDRFYI